MLTNHDMDSGSPFAAVLVGQPTLRHRLRLGVLAALDQRIAVRYAIAGMQPADTADYIAHHTKIAGRTDPLFSDDAITLIHNASRGYPRAVNNLAVHALTAAFAAEVTRSSTRNPPASPSPKVATTKSLIMRRHHTDDAVTTPTKTLPAPRTGSSSHQTIRTDHDGNVCILSDRQQR